MCIRDSLLIEENLPQSLLDKYKLMSRCQAVRAMHFPKDLAEYKQALRRIKFEELFYFQMQLQTLKSENRVQGSGLVLEWSQEKVEAVKTSLPFALTQACLLYTSPNPNQPSNPTYRPLRPSLC